MKKALLSAGIVLLADQLTKEWALSRLGSEPDKTLELFWGAKFQLHFNTGASFGTGAGLGPLIGVIVFGVTIFLLWMASQRRDATGQIILGCIAGGAIGNLVDRIFRAEDGFLSGAVVDFLQPVEFFAIFNVADAAVVVGVAAFLALSVLRPEAEAGGGTVSAKSTESVVEEPESVLETVSDGADSDASSATDEPLTGG